MSLLVIVLLIFLYLFIGCLIDYVLLGNIDGSVCITMILWPVMLLMAVVMLVFDMMMDVTAHTIIFIENLLNREE